jgi:sulfur carrier protein
MSTEQTIIVNGNRERTPAGASLVDLLRQMGLDPERPGMAVAVNLDIVRRPEWPNTVLREGDEVEVITATQGG